MKLLYTFALLFMISLSAHAVVYHESRVLTLAEMQKLGFQVEVNTLPGPKDARRHKITVFAMPTEDGVAVKWVSFSILEKALDADFENPKNSWKRDAAIWAKKIRGEQTDKQFFTFFVSDQELSFGYLLVTCSLPPPPEVKLRDWGYYYLPLSKLIECPKSPTSRTTKPDPKVPNQSSQPTLPTGG
jgi:hypothetical protein